MGKEGKRKRKGKRKGGALMRSYFRNLSSNRATPSSLRA